MFRFSIRDVLWLTTLIALGLWCLLQIRSARMANAELAKKNVTLVRANVRLLERNAQLQKLLQRENQRAESAEKLANIKPPPVQSDCN
jgi:hypothetical protein